MAEEIFCGMECANCKHAVEVADLDERGSLIVVHCKKLDIDLMSFMYCRNGRQIRIIFTLIHFMIRMDMMKSALNY